MLAHMSQYACYLHSPPIQNDKRFGISRHDIKKLQTFCCCCCAASVCVTKQLWMGMNRLTASTISFGLERPKKRTRNSFAAKPKVIIASCVEITPKSYLHNGIIFCPFVCGDQNSPLKILSMSSIGFAFRQFVLITATNEKEIIWM